MVVEHSVRSGGPSGNAGGFWDTATPQVVVEGLAVQDTHVISLLEHTTTRLYVERCRLTSEQREEGTVYIDKDITLVGGDSKRTKLQICQLGFIY